jgi:hypothetical protein
MSTIYEEATIPTTACICKCAAGISAEVQDYVYERGKVGNVKNTLS